MFGFECACMHGLYLMMLFQTTWSKISKKTKFRLFTRIVQVRKKIPSSIAIQTTTFFIYDNIFYNKNINTYKPFKINICIKCHRTFSIIPSIFFFNSLLTQFYQFTDGFDFFRVFFSAETTAAATTTPLAAMTQIIICH